MIGKTFQVQVHQAMALIIRDVIYLDFTKAFDSVSHGELLLKLYRLGIFGSLWNWYKSYLSRSDQFGYVNGAKSSILPVVSVFAEDSTQRIKRSTP